MILGRPTNLWLGFLTTVTSLVALLAVVVAKADGEVVATVVTSVTLVEGAAITLIAGQPPTLNPGDQYNVVTPTGQPNVAKVANTNVTPTPPVQVNP